MKQHQPSMSINEQIDNLKQLGLIIRDEQYAKETLNNISYFRLIKAYSLGLKDKGAYKENVSFEDIVDLYTFNTELRHMLFAQIERIEVGLRCRISNYFSDKYGIFGYKDINNFANQTAQVNVLQEIQNEITRNQKAPYIKNFQENYEGGEIPFYAAAEVLSFGSLSKFYKNMVNSDKQAVAKTYGLNFKYFESWIESIAFVRNICAHYGRLYNAKLPKKPRIYKQYTSTGVNNSKVFSVILCMKHIFGCDKEWIKFVNELEKLIAAHSRVNIRTMGFIKDWSEILKRI